MPLLRQRLTTITNHTVCMGVTVSVKYAYQPLPPIAYADDTQQYSVEVQKMLCTRVDEIICSDILKSHTIKQKQPHGKT